MKSLISNNWRKILVIIGIVFLVIILFHKIIAPKRLIEDYVKYGKDIESMATVIDTVTTGIEGPTTTVSPGIMKFTIIVMVLILFATFISTLGNKSADKAKKK